MRWVHPSAAALLAVTIVGGRAVSAGPVTPPAPREESVAKPASIHLRRNEVGCRPDAVQMAVATASALRPFALDARRGR